MSLLVDSMASPSVSFADVTATFGACPEQSDKGYSDKGEGQSNKGQSDRGQRTEDRGHSDRGQTDKGTSDRGHMQMPPWHLMIPELTCIRS